MMTNLPTDRVCLQRALDPCLLGRPVHLLDTFAARFREDLELALHRGHNRRYWSAFDVAEVVLARHERADGGERWIGYTNQGGRIGFALERRVLLAILEQRYGRRDAPAQANVQMRVTATEERLAVTLGQQLVQALTARLQANAQAVGASVAPQDFTSAPMPAPAKGCWTVRIVLADRQGTAQGMLWLALDDGWFAALLKGLAPVGAKTAPPPTQPLATRLQLTVHSHLTSKQIPLEELLELRIGDVIPVSIGRADVLVDDASLFTAIVAEHKGKLCLTSFEDTE
jgi:flagellar motor switch protein FliM